MLDVQHIFKTYEGKLLLNDISFQVDTGETICLLGASGSGKSTLLRIIAGLEDADSGTVSFNGIDITSLPPHLRDFGLVFQDYALFPHLSVWENVAFGLKMRRLPEIEIKERVVNSLEMVDLGGFEERQVTDLSGGEQQRVALARALATRPRLLMFDEPLGALDRTLREDLLQELRKILHQTTIPAVYVTHDQEEAFAIADRVLILHEGKIVRQGSPVDVWADPRSAFVARFLGLGLVVEGRVLDGTGKVETRYGVFNTACEHPHQTGETVHVLARPLPAEQEANTIQGVVSDVIFQQDRFKVTLENGFYVYVQSAPKVGEKLAVPVRIECLS
ncbi:MAG TPA: ABC transporter ATP-binding protein [Anaerolineales bacterium]|nr:ABC transporter ATP-binding protein [Anaerolineales bacterium]